MMAPDFVSNPLLGKGGGQAGAAPGAKSRPCHGDLHACKRTRAGAQQGLFAWGYLRELDDVLDAVDPDEGVLRGLLHDIARHEEALAVVEVCSRLRRSQNMTLEKPVLCCQPESAGDEAS